MVNVKIETMQDVINALQNHPELAEMFRAAIISRDMLELPQAVPPLAWKQKSTKSGKSWTAI